MPNGVLKVAESGIGGPDDLARLRDAGYAAALVGEHLVTSSNPGVALRELLAGV